MAFQECPACAELFTEYRLPDNSVAGNVFHFFWGGSGIITAPALEQLVTSWLTSWNLHVKARVSNQVSLIRLSARSLETETAPNYERVLSPAVPGTINSPAVPNNVTLSVKLGTGYTGRSSRGRFYFIGLSELASVGNFVQASEIPLIVNAWDDLREEIALSTEFFWAVLSRQTDGVERPTGLTRIITQISCVDNRIDTQRRRLPRLNN